jgi:hypothetical protein
MVVATPSPSPLPAGATDNTGELVTTLIAFVVMLGLSILLIARMRSANR